MEVPKIPFVNQKYLTETLERKNPESRALFREEIMEILKIPFVNHKVPYRGSYL